MGQTTYTPALIRTAPRRSTLRLALMMAVAGGVAVGFAATGTPAASVAVADAGAELTRLLRAMALISSFSPPAWFG
jgi:hypothetical protein